MQSIQSIRSVSSLLCSVSSLSSLSVVDEAFIDYLVSLVVSQFYPVSVVSSSVVYRKINATMLCCSLLSLSSLLAIKVSYAVVSLVFNLQLTLFQLQSIQTYQSPNSSLYSRPNIFRLYSLSVSLQSICSLSSLYVVSLAYDVALVFWQIKAAMMQSHQSPQSLQFYLILQSIQTYQSIVYLLSLCFLEDKCTKCTKATSHWIMLEERLDNSINLLGLALFIWLTSNWRMMESCAII